MLHWICIILSVATLVAFLFEMNFARNSVEAKGIVTKLTAGGSHVRVEFTANGRIINYQQNGIIRYKVGDEVRVLYNKEDPKNASTDAVGALWSWTIAFAILTLIFGLFAKAAVRFPDLIKSR